MDVFLEYTPRPYQSTFEDAMTTKNRALLVWHRRAGKDIACLNFMVLKAIEKIGLYYYILPTYRQAKKVIWDGMNEEGKKILDAAIPKKLIKNKHNTDLKIEFINGSIIQLVGSDNYDALAGTNPCGVVHSEFSLQDPACWQMIIRPILLKNKGWAVFNGTPRGKNHQFELDQIARENSNEWFYQKLTVEDTSLISHASLEQERREGVSEELIQQEYYCSYDRGVEGSYYGRLMETARKEGRICKVAYEARSPVNTSWDLGYGDSTAIIWWQEIDKEVRILDYYEATGEGLEHFIRQLNMRCYVYGTHYMPFDAENGSLQTGKSLVDMARQFGIKVTVLKRASFESGIEAGRVLMGISWFDQERSKLLLRHLTNYHKKYNDKMNCYSDKPEHDASSHGCDAFRYLALSRLQYGGSGIKKDQIDEWNQKYRNVI